MDNASEILKRGYLDVKVYVSGLRQNHRLGVEMQKTGEFEVPTLICKHYMPTQEMMKIANMTQMPVRYKDVVAFPQGKAPSDYKKKEEPRVKMESEVIEAEVE